MKLDIETRIKDAIVSGKPGSEEVALLTDALSHLETLRARNQALSDVASSFARWIEYQRRFYGSLGNVFKNSDYEITRVLHRYQNVIREHEDA